MKKAILAKKVGMTQIFVENGSMIPVTVLEAGPCTVVQTKTPEKDGSSAIQVGFGTLKDKRATKPQKGHYEAQLGKDAKPNKVLRELKLDDAASYEVGAEIKANMFAEGDRVDVTGISKGKGYQGTIKRYGNHRGPMTHGSKYHRGLGSMGSGTTPGSVKKGKKMPGHMGAVQKTVQNLTVVRADAEKNLLLIRGSVPGVEGAIVVVKSTTKN
jgi:large subunit ribosomal protein L3